MTTVQFIKTERGEELAILSKNEYKRLAALAADEITAQRVDKTRAALSAGQEVVLPKSIVDRLANYENPIRVLREWRGMTQIEFALAVGISQSYLSSLEAGKRKGPFALHQIIASALGVPFPLLLVPTYFIPPAAQREIGNVQRNRRRR